MEQDGKLQLISMVIAEEQRLQQVESDVGFLLASAPSTATVVYIISLGMKTLLLATVTIVVKRRPIRMSYPVCQSLSVACFQSMLACY